MLRGSLLSLESNDTMKSLEFPAAVDDDGPGNAEGTCHSSPGGSLQFILVLQQPLVLAAPVLAVGGVYHTGDPTSWMCGCSFILNLYKLMY